MKWEMGILVGMKYTTERGDVLEIYGALQSRVRVWGTTAVSATGSLDLKYSQTNRLHNGSFVRNVHFH